MMRIFEEQDGMAEHSEPEGKERRDMSANELSVEYQYGENKFKASGNAQDVNMHAAAFLSSLGHIQPSTSQKSLIGNGGTGQLPLFAENDTSPLADDGASNEETIVQEQPASTESVVTTMSLLDFFQEKSPKNQRDQVLVIAYFYLKHLKRSDINLEDYTEAFKLLRRLGVDMPSNMKSSVRNVVDRTNYLFNPDRGRFTLTVPGEKLVDSMPLAE